MFVKWIQEHKQGSVVCFLRWFLWNMWNFPYYGKSTGTYSGDLELYLHNIVLDLGNLLVILSDVVSFCFFSITSDLPWVQTTTLWKPVQTTAKKSSKFTKKITHVDNMMLYNLVKYLVQTRLRLWDIKITNFKTKNCPNDWLREPATPYGTTRGSRADRKVSL